VKSKNKFGKVGNYSYIKYMKENTLTKKFSKQLIEKLIEKKLTPKEMALELNINKRRIYDLLKFYNIQLIDKGRIIRKNDTFFDKIDNEIKAYLLGFLIADGCINIEEKKRNGVVYAYNKRISFCNSIDDLSTIELIKENICPNNKLVYTNNQQGVKFRKPQVKIRWTSPYMVNKLIEYGIHSNKTKDFSFKFDFSILKSEDLKIHFLRGFFDGDGCASISSKYKYVSVGFVTTSLPFIQQIIDFYKGYSLDFRIDTHKSKNMDYYQIWLRGGKQSIISFKKLMYNNANFFLQRKFNKFIYDDTELNKENKTFLSV
jgi:LAGLIDADG-like domain